MVTLISLPSYQQYMRESGLFILLPMVGIIIIIFKKTPNFVKLLHSSNRYILIADCVPGILSVWDRLVRKNNP